MGIKDYRNRNVDKDVDMPSIYLYTFKEWSRKIVNKVEHLRIFRENPEWIQIGDNIYENNSKFENLIILKNKRKNCGRNWEKYLSKNVNIRE